MTKRADYDFIHIKYLRQLRQKSQTEFAKLCGLKQPILSNIENGELRLSDYYKSKIDYGFRRLRISHAEVKLVKEMTKYALVRGRKV